MAVSGALVSVGTTPTIVASVPVGSRPNAFAIQNVGTVDVFLGGPAVTTSVYGHRLAPGGTISVDLDNRETLFGVVASGTNSVAVLSAGW